MIGIMHAHSGLRWIILILLLVAIVNAFVNKDKSYLKKDKMINLFTMVFFHIQVLLGIILYFNSGKVSHVAGWMKNSILRFYGMEHVLMMVLAMVFITMGYSKSKKKDTDAQKHKVIRVFYIITLILVLAGIPWPFRNLGAGWF